MLYQKDIFVFRKYEIWKIFSNFQITNSLHHVLFLENGMKKKFREFSMKSFEKILFSTFFQNSWKIRKIFSELKNQNDFEIEFAGHFLWKKYEKRNNDTKLKNKDIYCLLKWINNINIQSKIIYLHIFFPCILQNAYVIFSDALILMTLSNIGYFNCHVVEFFSKFTCTCGIWIAIP